jgi:tetratricopeptide (TPR) repeat protein
VRLGPKLSEGFRDGPGELVRPMLLSLAQLAAELNPSPQTFTRVGAALRQNGRHKESVPMFEEAAELEPSAKAYTYWGMALRDSERHAEARAVFAKAIEADPKLANGYNQLGLSYLDEEQWDKAADQFATAMKLSPQWSNYQYNLGLAQRGAGKLDEAIASFQKTIAIYPSHAWSYAQWGATLAQRERRDSGTVSEETAKRVEEKLKRAVELKPNDKIVLEALREAYETMDRREQAIDAHRRTLAIGDGMQGGLNSEIKPIDRPVGGGEF